MKAIFAAAVSAAVLAASPALAESWKDQYKTVKFGILSGENEKDRIARYTPFEKYLENELGVDVEIFHSNIEGRVIDRFYEAHEGDVDATVINPAGYTTGHPALAAAISQVRFPTIELHVSNPAARGNVSEIAPVCRGVILGFGLFGYYLAIRGALDLVSSGT